MLKFSTGKSKPGWGKPECRPPWWPDDVPWANVRSDVRDDETKRMVNLYSFVLNCDFSVIFFCFPLPCYVTCNSSQGKLLEIDMSHWSYLIDETKTKEFLHKNYFPLVEIKCISWIICLRTLTGYGMQHSVLDFNSVIYTAF